MVSKKVIKLFEGYGNRTGYGDLSLTDLIKRIVEKDDLLALDEFHKNRSLFRFNNGPPLRFTDFLNELRENTIDKKRAGTDLFEIADYAYDLTLDKFNNLPNKNRPCSSPKRGAGEIKDLIVVCISEPSLIMQKNLLLPSRLKARSRRKKEQRGLCRALSDVIFTCPD